MIGNKDYMEINNEDDVLDSGIFWDKDDRIRALKTYGAMEEMPNVK